MAVVVCKWCHRRKAILSSGTLVCTDCDFGPCGMLDLPCAAGAKDVQK